ncbi:MAG: hypothetical protein Unbinned2716contig1000_20 [Prokaryotic dsDNA virus sp.]|nr:MAG: hypothetical protein Unbinned2716contig1000_20 [Prokaryotic dsDNA virus sp.]|tara:strand:+ start:18831 stop:19187 length:357 start_codon:yes stop_codon:yes gene_type:complete
MANKDRFTPEKIADALRKNAGLISLTATALNCTRKTIYNYIEKFPELQEVLEDIRESMDDIAEAALLKNIKEGSTQEILYYHKRRLGHRGYGDNKQIDITSNNEPIKINIDLGDGDNS